MSRRGAFMNMPLQADQQLCLDLPVNPHREIGSGAVVHRNHDYSAERTSEESCNPLGGVLAPHHDAVALHDPARFQLTGKAEGHIHDLAVGKRLHAVPAPLPDGALMPMPLKVLDEEFR